MAEMMALNPMMALQMQGIQQASVRVMCVMMCDNREKSVMPTEV